MRSETTISELKTLCFFDKMPLLSLMASSHTGCLPALVLHQEQATSRQLKDFRRLLPSSGSRQEILRSSILSLTPNEHGDLFKSMSESYGYGEYVRAARRMSLLGDMQDKQPDYILFSFGINEQWTKHKKLRFLLTGSNELEKDYLDPFVFPELAGIQATPTDMHLLHLGSTDFEFNNLSGAYTSLHHPSGKYYDLEAKPDLVQDLLSSTVSVHADGQLSFGGNMTDMKDLVSMQGEFKLTKDSAWRKQVLVPDFRWNDAINLQDRTYTSSLKLDSLAVVPLKRCKKVKQKPSSKRKSKRAVGDRDLYKNNSIQACEMLLSLMMDKKRNGKSVTNSLKKAGPALPLLLTQFSASITGTGLAVIFSVIWKVACGSIPLCTSNLLTSGFGVGLFWLSWAVNKLRDTIIYIGKNSMKLEFEEEEMMMRVNKSMKDILFRAGALMAVLVLRFA